MKIVFFIGLLSSATAVTLDQTPYDDPWQRACPMHMTFSRIESEHNNRKEDRTWTFTCKQSPVKFTGVDRWSQEWTSFDAQVRQECGLNEVICGLESQHSNRHEDRQWKYMCRQLTYGQLVDCMWSGFWINDMDGDMNFDIPSGHVLTGLLSEHSNRYEDRRFKVKTCRYMDKICYR